MERRASPPGHDAAEGTEGRARCPSLHEPRALLRLFGKDRQDEPLSVRMTVSAQRAARAVRPHESGRELDVL